jgi:hypothetical protein
MVDVMRFRWGREAKGDLLQSSLVKTWPNLRLEVALVTGCVALDLIVAGGVQSGRASDSRRRPGSPLAVADGRDGSGWNECLFTLSNSLVS